MRLLVLLVALIGIAGAAVRAETVIERMVSPGALSAGHARLESRCTACHLTFQRQAQPRQCLTCHTGIARDIATHTRWHGRVAVAQRKPCSGCHIEHQRGAQPIIGPPLAVLKQTGFNHDTMTAYALTGGHARTRCVACHAGMVRLREAPQACAACHARQDVHRGRLGPACQSCHTTARWRDLLPFDHDKTRYPLTGGHRAVACKGCHAGEQWHGVSTACVSCHVRADVHRGADGPHCASCHLTTTWRAIRFDHDTVHAFPLQGAHVKVACTGCHANTARPASAPVACAGCHTRDDVHRGADGPKCAECHSQSTWKVAKFDHAKTAFPLIGYHTRVTCVACHPKSVDTVKPGKACIDCHVRDDVHNGALGPMCQRCHKPTGFIIPGVPRIPGNRHPKMEGKGRPIDFPRSGLKD
ncbi:cytochrome c family protein [Novosphingobium sp.]|uniref:cytochrome c family protein n=1 Tax=Novosphingobium sp. TaxID=1874826 RepID=UPI003341CB07